MARQPGPQQNFPSRITRIQFPSIGGMVYFRVGQRFSGQIPAPGPFAQVEGLPWDSFNMFNVTSMDDPEASAAIKAKEVHVEDPVTDDMLAKFLYWAQHPARTETRVTEQGEPTEFYVVDTASWTLVYANHITGTTSQIMTQAAALAEFQGLIGSPGYEGLDPNLMGAALINNTFEDISVNPPSLDFWNGVAAGWTYHTEQSPGYTITDTDNVASVIINLAQLFRDTPNGPNGKKPAFIDFTITPPSNSLVPPGTGRLQWWLQAEAFTSKITKPQDGGPKYDAGERRDFPVRDKVKPVSGIPGAYTTLFDLPDETRGWVEFPNEDADIDEEQDWGEGTVAKVRITFGVGAVLPKVSIVFEATEGPVVG